VELIGGCSNLSDANNNGLRLHRPKLAAPGDLATWEIRKSQSPEVNNCPQKHIEDITC
jgi:hypothetical protein